MQKIEREREQVKRIIQAQMDTMSWIKNQKREAIQFINNTSAVTRPRRWKPITPTFHSSSMM